MKDFLDRQKVVAFMPLLAADELRRAQERLRSAILRRRSVVPLIERSGIRSDHFPLELQLAFITAKTKTQDEIRQIVLNSPDGEIARAYRKGIDLSDAEALQLARQIVVSLPHSEVNCAVDEPDWDAINAETHAAHRRAAAERSPNGKGPAMSTNGSTTEAVPQAHRQHHDAAAHHDQVPRDRGVAPHQDDDVRGHHDHEVAGRQHHGAGERRVDDAEKAKPNVNKEVYEDRRQQYAPLPRDEPLWKRGSFTAEQLQGVKFTPVSFLVKDIIPAEGVTLLCSKPKFGKSWLVYEICIGCTTNRIILGELLPAQGDVLYLALEDSARRLQHRMKKLLPAGAPWPAKLTLKTEWRRLHEGGLDDIRGWFEHTKEKGGSPVAVAIDVLAKVRKPTGKQQLYEADYAALADLTKLANELGIAVIVVHHTRKMAADDLMETVSGSYGVSGAVDTILVMANKGSGAVLDARGRDLESRELAIEFNKNTCRWRILGAATEVHVSAQRARVLAALQDAPEGLPVAEIKVAAELPTRNAADVLLYKMTKAGEIERVKRGVYRLGGTDAAAGYEEARKD